MIGPTRTDHNAPRCIHAPPHPDTLPVDVLQEDALRRLGADLPRRR